MASVSLAGTVAINDSGEVIVDGINAGRVCDVVYNYPTRLPEIKSAVEAKVNANCNKNPKFCKAVVDALEVKIAIDKDIKATLTAKVQELTDTEAASAKKAADQAIEDSHFFK